MPPPQDRQAAARSGRWRRHCRRPYKLSSDLSSQPKRPGDLDLLFLKVISESHVTWASSMAILVFLGLCCRLRPDVRDRQDVRQHHRMPPPGAGHNKQVSVNADSWLPHVIVTLMTYDKQSNARRTPVES